MKKLLFALGFTLVSITAFSQAEIAIGLKGGINLASIDTESVGANYNNRTGFHAGAYGLIKLTKFAIQPEVLYSVQGSSIDLSGISDDLSQDLIYLNIPIMLKFYTVAGINLQAGPQFGMLVNAEQEIANFDIEGNYTGKSTQDVADNLKNSDLSIALGAGWDAPFGLNVTARYVLGLSDINDVSGAEEQSTRTFQISLGYRLLGLGN